MIGSGKIFSIELIIFLMILSKVKASSPLSAKESLRKDIFSLSTYPMLTLFGGVVVGSGYKVIKLDPFCQE